MRAIVDNPKLFDCFPGVEIKGGVNYFLWDRDHDEVPFYTALTERSPPPLPGTFVKGRE